MDHDLENMSREQPVAEVTKLRLCAGTIQRCGRYCQNSRVCFQGCRIGRGLCAGVSGIAIHSTNRCLTHRGRTNRISNEPHA